MVEALRRLDPLLDVKWDPKAIMTAGGSYSVGGIARRPEYDGRWLVVRFDTPTKLRDDRDYVVITMVTAIDETDVGRCMISRGPYAPIGMWLVGYMQRWDSAQAHFAAEMEQLAAQHDAAEALDTTNDAALHQEVLNRVFRELGGMDTFTTGGKPMDQRTLVTTP